MGSSFSYLFPSQYRRQQLLKSLGNKAEVMQNLRQIGLDQSSLLQLLEIYDDMDIDHSGTIHIGEFFAYIELEPTAFCTKAFTLMDKDGSGEVDFIEFVMNLWNYCSLGKSNLVRFAFDLCDSDGSGEIGRSELEGFLCDVWGSGWTHNPHAGKVFSQLENLMTSNESGCLHFGQFEHYCECHPMLLFPAFELQSGLQDRVLGERFWRNVAKKRAKLDPHDHKTECFNHIVHMAHAISRRQLPATIRRPTNIDVKPRPQKLVQRDPPSSRAKTNNESSPTTKHKASAAVAATMEHAIRTPTDSMNKSPPKTTIQPMKSWKKAYSRRSNAFNRSSVIAHTTDARSSIKGFIQKLTNSPPHDANTPQRSAPGHKKYLVVEDIDSPHKLSNETIRKKQPRKLK